LRRRQGERQITDDNLVTERPLMRVLVIEDDRQTAKLVKSVLTEGGDAVDLAYSAADARPLARINEYDVIILDLSLPDGTGIEILQELRREGRVMPVLVMTGRSGEADVVRLLDAGADDYVVKPVPNEVLKARVRALVRRGGTVRATETLTVGSLVLNRVTHRVFDATREISLTPREFSLLQHFMLHAGDVVSRTELLEKVWDMHFDPGSNVVDANVARLRRKIDGSPTAPVINTVRGVGFKLEPRSAS
jgi:two-component system OmpR family response regulator